MVQLVDIPLTLQASRASKLPKLSHALQWTQLSTNWKFQGLKLSYVDADWVCQMLSAKKVVWEFFLNMSKHLIFTFSRRKCFGLEMRKCFILIFPMWQCSDFFLSKWQVLCCLKLTKIFPVSEPFYFKDPEYKRPDSHFVWMKEFGWAQNNISLFFLCQ